MKKTGQSDFSKGVYNGLPIAFGYIPLAFSFGTLAINGGYNFIVPTVMSLLSFTGAGQMAGIQMMIQAASIISIFLVNLVINSRYLVMCLSMNQRITEKMPFWKKMFIAFGMTDENFTVASLYVGKLSFPFFAGLILTSFSGWVLGTLVGALVIQILPSIIQEALSITIYAMFCGLLLPAVKKSGPIAIVTAISVAVSCLFWFIPVLAALPSGINIIVPTVLAAAICAWLFPMKEQQSDDVKGENSDE